MIFIKEDLAQYRLRQADPTRPVTSSAEQFPKYQERKMVDGEAPRARSVDRLQGWINLQSYWPPLTLPQCRAFSIYDLAECVDHTRESSMHMVPITRAVDTTVLRPSEAGRPKWGSSTAVVPPLSIKGVLTFNQRYP